MMKYWILGEDQKALQQSNMIWTAHRDRQVSAAPKPLVAPWLRRDWPEFIKAQRKDFNKLWQRAKKDGWTVKAEDATRVIVTTEKYQIGHQWCWSHCGLALLAHRAGAQIATDEFWFPKAAIYNPEHMTKQGSNAADANQLEIF